MVDLSTEPPDIIVAREVAKVLAAHPGLAGFFGDRIAAAQAEELRLAFPLPALFACTTKIGKTRRPGGVVRMTADVQVRAYFPRLAPAAGWIPIPTFTVSSTTGAAYQYRLTQFGPDGESLASEAVASSGLGTLTLPSLASGMTGFRVWRSEAGRTACRWIETVFVPGAWVDTVVTAKTELAPVLGLGERVLAMVESVFLDETTDAEYLPTISGHVGDAEMQMRPAIGKITNRNLELFTTELSVNCLYDPTTQAIVMR